MADHAGGLLRQVITSASGPGGFSRRLKDVLRTLARELDLDEAAFQLAPSATQPSAQIIRAGGADFFQPAHLASPASSTSGGGDAQPVARPVQFKNTPLGTLYLFSPRSLSSHTADLQATEALLGQMVWYERELQNEEERSRRLDLGADISRRLNRADRVRWLLAEVLQTLVQNREAICAVMHHAEVRDSRPPLVEIAPRFAPLRERFLRQSEALYRRCAAGEPFFAAEISHFDEDNQKFTALAVPLVYQERLLGALVLVGAHYPDAVQPFSEERKRFLQDVGTQTATAWARISALQRLEALSIENDRKFRELSLLYRISQVLHTTLGLNDLMHFILSVVVLPDGADCDRAMLFMVNERSGILQGMLGVTYAEAGTHFSDAQDLFGEYTPAISPELQKAQRSSPFCRLVMQQRLPLDPSANALARAVRDGRLVEIREPAEDPASDTPFAKALRLKSYICAPLKGREETLAVLVVDNCESQRDFDDGHLRFLQLFANQAGAAVENAMLVNRLKTAHHDLHQTQEQLIQIEKLATIGEIAASVAHELKNPLVCVGGFAQRLTRQLDPESQPGKYAAIIGREIRRVEEMLTNILAFSKRQLLCLAPCRVADVIDSALQLFETDLPRKGIRLSKEIKSDLPEIIADEKQLRQVLINLFSNAREAMDQGGELIVRAAQSTLRGDPAVTITVEDTGGGIPQESLRNIFNPFFTSKVSGTGLGLSISHRIIEHHHGAMEVHNSARGAIFLIHLPAKSALYSSA